jgi:hypothetical protein
MKKLGKYVWVREKINIRLDQSSWMFNTLRWKLEQTTKYFTSTEEEQAWATSNNIFLFVLEINQLFAKKLQRVKAKSWITI